MFPLFGYRNPLAQPPMPIEPTELIPLNGGVMPPTSMELLNLTERTWNRLQFVLKETASGVRNGGIFGCIFGMVVVTGNQAAFPSEYYCHYMKQFAPNFNCQFLNCGPFAFETQLNCSLPNGNFSTHYPDYPSGLTGAALSYSLKQTILTDLLTVGMIAVTCAGIGALIKGGRAFFERLPEHKPALPATQDSNAVQMVRLR